MVVRSADKVASGMAAWLSCSEADVSRQLIGGDLDNLTIAAPTVNRSQKSDRDAGEWGPPENRGWFASRVVAVKQEYELSVNPTERDALAGMLSSDPSREVTCGTTGTGDDDGTGEDDGDTTDTDDGTDDDTGDTDTGDGTDDDDTDDTDTGDGTDDDDTDDTDTGDGTGDEETTPTPILPAAGLAALALSLMMAGRRAFQRMHR